MFEGTESGPRKEPASGAPVSEDDPAGAASGLQDESTGAADATPRIGAEDQQEGQTTVPAPEDDVNKGAGSQGG